MHKSGGLGLRPGTCGKVEGETNCTRLSSALHMRVLTHTPTRNTHTHTIMIQCVCGGCFIRVFPVCRSVYMCPLEKQARLLTPKPPPQLLFHSEVRILSKKAEI